MTFKHSANSVRAKARNRFEQPPADYVGEIPRGPVREIIVRDLLNGSEHVISLSISRKRIDQFSVDVDGKRWLDSAGMSRVLAGIRKSLPRFSKAKAIE